MPCLDHRLDTLPSAHPGRVPGCVRRAWPGALLLAAAACAGHVRADTQLEEVRAALRRSADWHLAHPGGTSVTDWIIAPFYDGLVRTALVLDEPRHLAAVLDFGRRAGWSPRWRVHHADDHAVGHAWLDIHLMDRSRLERLAPFRARFEEVLARQPSAPPGAGRPLDMTQEGAARRWNWSDALYMAPPTAARLFTATGDGRYLEFLEREYRFAIDLLYDREERLFYRDTRFKDRRTANGRKVFWGRGNGWVYAGLALVLEHVPETHPSRPLYEGLFREMTTAVLATQQSDGLWRPSLLDPGEVPVGETSASGFLLFGLAWGLNQGLLPAQVCRPAIDRGWQGLVTRVRADGCVGYVQPRGSAPGPVAADSSDDFGTGAFLLAGCEVLRSIGGAAAPGTSDLLRRAEELVAVRDRTPRAWARIAPECKDDIAWENDKVAFRIHGPADLAGVVGGGIDAWCKRVSSPVIDRGDARALAGGPTCHPDHGEDYDGSKAGDSLGCGGTGLWFEGRLVTPGVYRAADVFWTGDDVAEVRAIYQYPVALLGRPVFEFKTIRLQRGRRLNEITSLFSEVGGRNPRPIAGFDLPVVVGLVTRSGTARPVLDPSAGVAAVHDELAGTLLQTGIAADPRCVIGMDTQAHAGEPRGARQVLVFLRPDANATVRAACGFAWAGDGELTTAEAWLHHLGIAAGRNDGQTP